MVKGKLEKKDEKKEKEVKINNNSLSRILIVALIGIIFILIPETINDLLGYIVGGAFLILGIYTIYKTLTTDNNGFDLASGILYTVMGIVIIFNPGSIVRLISICFGVYLFICGILKLGTSMSLRKLGASWSGTLVVAIIIMILGLLLIVNVDFGLSITKLAGIFMVLLSAFDLLDIYVLQKK